MLCLRGWTVSWRIMKPALGQQQTFIPVCGLLLDKPVLRILRIKTSTGEIACCHILQLSLLIITLPAQQVAGVSYRPHVTVIQLPNSPPIWILFKKIKRRCMYRASYCNVLMTNEMHNSYNQFLFHSFFACSTCFERI